MTDPVRQMAEGIVGVLSDLFTDHDPVDNGDGHLIFTLSEGLRRKVTGVPELDDAFLDAQQRFADQYPRASWKIDAGYNSLVRSAQILLDSADRPGTQISGRSFLEMLVRDDTRYSNLRVPAGTRTVHELSTPAGRFSVTIGPPTPELLLRVKLKRGNRMDLDSPVFDRLALFGHLMEIEQTRGLRAQDVAHIDARRLVRAAAPHLLSLRVDGPAGATIDDMEQVATAVRTRLAYEASIVLAPVLDVDNLDRTPSQPKNIRQLFARADEFVDAIGNGTPTGHMGDRQLGRVTIADEELSLRYLRAVAANDGVSAYMGYYHLLEYMMEDAWYVDLQAKVVAHGHTPPKFSGDVRATEKEAKPLVPAKTDIYFTERKGLLGVIEQYVDLAALANDLERHTFGALTYFAQTCPSFCTAPTLDLATGDTALLQQSLMERIYKVRCAITHTKASGDRFNPYVHDIELAQEITLVRFAAEQMLVPAEDRL